MSYLLMRLGANVNLKSKDGWTALHLAAYYGFVANNDTVLEVLETLSITNIYLKDAIKRLSSLWHMGQIRMK